MNREYMINVKKSVKNIRRFVSDNNGKLSDIDYINGFMENVEQSIQTLTDQKKERIVYCLDCDDHYLWKQKEGNYCECSCGEHAPVISNKDIVSNIAKIQHENIDLLNANKKLTEENNSLRCCGNCDQDSDIKSKLSGICSSCKNFNQWTKG